MCFPPDPITETLECEVIFNHENKVGQSDISGFEPGIVLIHRHGEYFCQAENPLSFIVPLNFFSNEKKWKVRHHIGLLGCLRVHLLDGSDVCQR